MVLSMDPKWLWYQGKWQNVGLQFMVSRVRVRDKVRVSVSDRVGVRFSDGVRVSTF